MNNLKKIVLLAIFTVAFVSCKKETTEVNEATPVENVKDTVAIADLKTTSFTIEGMTCEVGCANTIESKLSGLDGVKEAKVDFENKLATVSFDATKQSPESLTEVVEAVAGGDIYKVSNVK